MRKFLFVLSLLLGVCPVLLAQQWTPPMREDLSGARIIGDFLVTVKGAKYALLDKNLAEVLPAEYDKIEAEGLYIKAIKGDRTSLYNPQGKKLFTLPGINIAEVFSDGYVTYSGSSGKVGILDTLGNELLSPAYAALDYIGSGYFRYRWSDAKIYGVIDVKGNIVIGDSLLDIKKLEDGLIPARHKDLNKIGYLDLKGSWAIPPVFADAYPFEGGVARVSDNGGEAFSASKVSLDSKYGLIDRTGKLLLNYTYVLIDPFSPDGLAVVTRKADDTDDPHSFYKYGAIDKSGKIIVPPGYDNVYPFKNGFAVVTKASKTGLVNTTGKVVIPIEYSSLSSAPEAGLYICKKGSKYGVIKATGQIVVPVEYDYIGEYKHGVAWLKNGTVYSLIDKAGKTVFTSKTDMLPTSYIFPGVAYVYMKPTHYLFNDKGQKILDLPYDMVANIKDGVMGVKKGVFFGFVDIKGKEIVTPSQNNIVEFSEGIGAVQATSYDTPYFIDRTGKKLFSAGNYVYHGPFSQGLAKVFVNTSYSLYYTDYRVAFIDKTGSIRFTTTYFNAGPFKNGYALVQNYSYSDTTYGLIDTTGKEVYKVEYRDIGEMSADGLVPLRSKQLKWGFGDKTGKIVIPLEYEEMSNMLDGLALVRKNGKVGMIDTSGNTRLEFIYDNGQELTDINFIVLKKGDLWGAVDKGGKTVIDFKYDYLASSKNGVAWAKWNGKWGIVDYKGVWKEMPPLKDARAFDNGLAVIVNEEGKSGVLDKTGKIIIAPVLDEIGDFDEGVVVAKLRGGFEKVMVK